MEIDPTTVLGAATRTVEHTSRDGKAARAVVVARRFATDVDDLWEAVTTAERIARWFLPVSGSLEVGGRFQLEGNAGGEVLTCEAPNRFEVTWEMGETTWVEVTLAADGDGTLLTLRHTAPVPDPDPFWDQFGPGAVGVGWDGALMGLDLHVGSGEAVDPAESMAWMTSENGRAFYAAASEGWRDASIAAGTDPAAAAAAGERTTAFYTGAEPPAE